MFTMLKTRRGLKKSTTTRTGPNNARHVVWALCESPEDPTSRYILDMYRVSKCMSYLTDFHFPSAVGNINNISNGLKVFFLLYKVTQ